MTRNNPIVEASSLNLPPGRWPLSLTFQGRHWRQYSIDTNDDGEVLEVCYTDDDGNVLTVVND